MPMIRWAVEDGRLATIPEDITQSDVTAWGVVALVCTGLAVLGANLATLLPSSALLALHSPRNDAVSIVQIRQQVAELRAATAELRRQNDTLTTRFSLQEQSGGEAARRLGALEVALPVIMESRPTIAPIDRTVTTASITGTPSQQFEAEGGTVVVRQSPLEQPIPAPIQLASASGAQVGYAVAVGSSFSPGQAAMQWRNLEVQLGSLTVDLTPLLSNATDSNQQRIVLGPIAKLSDARDLCAKLEQREIACSPASYAGVSMAR
ncbi:hypothetical protein ASG47_19025 [Devosia sp. Leaf420]|uniref:hypothetical protein n=1 Tax=Devosia sp. Leaf420 TaxID=1736374 RepID=UPI000715313E|nr:hypothetical protein [Devosia sp. Leaf420]KQT51262.1 hypothetical protein ASG47_19025 [Devosia sp. Leaf420]